MRHVSTRGEAPPLNFTEALLAGLARDGGLYVPERWPGLAPAAIAGLAGVPYAKVAQAVLAPLIEGDIAPAVLARMSADAYASFRHPAVCPLVQLGDNLFLLELFHGPTLAFKDLAMQLLGRFIDHALGGRGTRATIVGATSGDTGSAAVAAFADLDRVDLFILYPHGRISEVQRRQMTTNAAGNIHAVAIEGTFDDCQAIVKALFGKPALRDELALSGINSINWARVAAQAVYYVTAAVSLGAPHRPVSFAVPTGNFGDVLAGYVAKRMGLPVGRLMIATNANDILARALATGLYSIGPVTATTSPSMDIQVSSNFERLLFEASGRDADLVVRLMAELAAARAFTIPAPVLACIRADFSAQAVDEATVMAEIGATVAAAGYVLDPHSAVGVHAARRLLGEDPATPVVALATAHPAKFPDAVERASGVRPALPAHLADLLQREERVSLLPNDAAAVERFMRARTRAVRSGA